MSNRIAGIDVHKRMLAVAVAEAEGEGEYQFQRRWFAAMPGPLRELGAWLAQERVQEVVMESTAQYWRPVWGALERFWAPEARAQAGASASAGKLHLAQARSNRGARGRKNDFADAERLVKRLVAGELILSFVPEPEQRLWRTVTRRRERLCSDRTRLQNQLETLLEEAHIKLSSLVSDLLGVSGRRMLRALAEGQSYPEQIAQLADRHLHASQERLRDALEAAGHLHPVYRRLLQMSLEQLELLDRQIAALEQQAADLMRPFGGAIERLAHVPGLRVRSAQQIVAEVGPSAATFPSAKAQSSWVGVCPGQQESAGANASSRSPRGNRPMRRILNQAAHAAVKLKGSIFEIRFHRLLPRLGYKAAIWAIAHQLCRVVWKILHDEVAYQERGPFVIQQRLRIRTNRMVRELKRLGYRVDQPMPLPVVSA